MATFRKGKRFGNKTVSHIEAEGCIVNIYEDLSDRHGRKVTAIEVIPDHYVGDYWKLYASRGNLRVVRLKDQKKRR